MAVFKNKFMIDNSEVTLSIFSDMDWETLVIFRTKAQLLEKDANREDIVIPTYREIKNWLIKGE